MNTVDFTNPNGFPLEADNTLGFMQEDYQSGLKGLAQAYGDEQAFVIISGCVDDGVNVSDGWILVNGELNKFVGGEKTEFIISDENTVQKANLDGQLYDRYTTKIWRFGSVANPNFLPPFNQVAFGAFRRLETVATVVNSIYRLAKGTTTGQGFRWVILDGLQVANNGADITAGVAIYDGKILVVSGYEFGAGSENSPRYLSTEGIISTQASSGALEFTPYTGRRFEHLLRNAGARTGEIRWQLTSGFPAVMFDATGLGRYEWNGWAKANGQNGTTDLSTSIAGLTAIQRI